MEREHGCTALPSAQAITLSKISEFYPNIKALISVLCTLPVTSCSSWYIRWKSMEREHGCTALPSAQAITLSKISEFYPNIKALISVLCTLPVTSCSRRAQQLIPFWNVADLQQAQLEDSAIGPVARKGPPRAIRAPMGQHNVGSLIERIVVDVLGPLPESEQGNKYLLILADYFTKWTEAFPLPNQEATSVAEVVVKEVVSRYGVSLVLHSDQGRNFESIVSAEMCRLLGIQKTRTTPLHPQSDGMVESFNHQHGR